MNRMKASGIVLGTILLIGGIAGGYFYFSTMFPGETPPGEAVRTAEETFFLRVYYPAGNQIQVEERRPPRKAGLMAVAEATIGEYLKGPAGGKETSLPKDAKLLGMYKGSDRILYIDLSIEFRRNFQGDAFAEFLLLKSLYESIISNVEDIQDVKVLIEGKETETLGGHLNLLYPLKDIVTYGD